MKFDELRRDAGRACWPMILVTRLVTGAGIPATRTVIG
jgi:hypothetical protein